MKLRKTLLLRIAAAWLLGFASVGCGSNDDPVDPVPPAPDPVESSLFIITLDELTALSVNMHVSPADKRMTYYFDVLDDNDFRMASERGIDNYLQWMLNDLLMGEYGYSFSEAVRLMTSVGDDNAELSDLEPGAKYHAIAVGIDDEGYATTEVVAKEFTTLPAAVSDNTFRITVANVGHTDADITVATANGDPYFLDVQPVGADEGMDEGVFARYLIGYYTSWGGLPERCLAGSRTVGLKRDLDVELKPGWKYEVVVFGYDNGMVTTPIERVPLNTLTGGNPASCGFAFDYELALYDYSSFTFMPSDPLAVYLGDVIDEASYQQYLAYCGGDPDKAMREVLNTLIDYYAADFQTSVETVNAIAQLGTTELSINLEQDTEYRVWAVCISQQGDPVAPFVVGEPFRSMKNGTTDAGVELADIRWYDGDELYAADPRTFASARGYAVLALQAKPSASAAHWYIYSFLGDLSASSDRNIVKNLMMMGDSAMDQTEMLIICYWGENTICSVAMDEAGNYGPIGREVVNFTKEGASPVPSQFRVSSVCTPRRITADTAGRR